MSVCKTDHEHRLVSPVGMGSARFAHQEGTLFRGDRQQKWYSIVSHRRSTSRRKTKFGFEVYY